MTHNNQVSMFDNEKIKSTDWKWTMANDYPKQNGIKVFSCFACGGGSTMGYKLAGCEVIGDLEIDKRMNDVYVANHHPKYNFLMDIREFNKKEDLPEELFNLDILDGSPPCSTFSTAGQREKAWGKEKKFREGQASQTLDDLLFIFLDTVNKLKPKTFIMENVEGLMLGNAWKYVQEIYKKSKEIGYNIKHFLLKGEKMGVPQTRHRVFFIGVRTDIDFDIEKVDMSFNYEPISYKKIEQGEHKKRVGKVAEASKRAKRGDINLLRIARELYGKDMYFSERIQWKENVLWTITGRNSTIWVENFGYTINNNEIINAQTFPQDFDFLKENIQFICGMSVPPIMIKRIVNRLIESGLFNQML